MKNINLNQMQEVSGGGAGTCIVATIAVSVFFTPVAGMYTGLACWLAVQD